MAYVFDQTMAFHVLIHVEITMGVHPDGVSAVAQTSVQWAVPRGDDVAVKAEDAHESIQFRHVQDFVVIDVDITWSGQAAPFFQIFTICVEDLDPVILAVSHKYPTICVHPNAVGNVEFARTGLARLTPREQQFSVSGELVYPGVARAVWDI